MSTQKRPVPLEHSLHTCGKLFTILDDKGSYNGLAFKQAAAALKVCLQIRIYLFFQKL
jgi:superfamily II RNA helicase